MGYEQLEINRLSPSGEVLRRIRCLAGRVTVFRSHSETELELYKNALEGKAQGERFSVLLDGAVFRPQDHCFIGFGEKLSTPNLKRVSEYMIGSGVDPDQLEPLLLSYGLGGLSGATFADLTPGQERVLRILAETLQSKRVIVLNDPFDVVDERWRDPIAERLTKFVWEKKGIVVVCKLSNRPESWIENDLIARMQLERPRQRTIGFGGGDNSSAQTFEAFRKEFASEHGKEVSSTGANLLAAGGTGVTVKAKGLSRILGSTGLPSMKVIYAMVGAVSIVAGGYIFASLGRDKPVEQIALHADPSIGSQGTTTPVATPPAPAVQPLADLYPEEIRVAWLTAFEHPEQLVKAAANSVSSEQSVARILPNPSSIDPVTGEPSAPSEQSQIRKFYQLLQETKS